MSRTARFASLFAGLSLFAASPALAGDGLQLPSWLSIEDGITLNGPDGASLYVSDPLAALGQAFDVLNQSWEPGAADVSVVLTGANGATIDITDIGGSLEDLWSMVTQTESANSGASGGGSGEKVATGEGSRRSAGEEAPTQVASSARSAAAPTARVLRSSPRDLPTAAPSGARRTGGEGLRRVR